MEAGLNLATHSANGLKITNNADINNFVSIHHSRAVVNAQLYFLYFIFLTEVRCTSQHFFGNGKFTAEFYTACFQFDTVLLSCKKMVLEPRHLL